MEPVSAPSLACNVLQLVELALEAVRACKQIYHTGSLEQNDRLKNFAIAVIEGHHMLGRELSINKSHNARLRMLTQDVNATAQELHKVLNSVKFAKQGKASGELLKKSIQSLVKRGKIEKLQSRLQEQESMLRSGLLKSIYVSYNESDRRQSVALASLEIGQQRIINEFIKGHSRVHDGIIQEVKESESRIIANSAAAALPFMSAIQATESLITAQNQAQTAKFQQIIDDQASRLKKTILDVDVSTLAQLAATEDILKRDVVIHNLKRDLETKREQLLDMLYFDTLPQRENMIDSRVDDFGGTCSWIFEESRGHTFAEWLRNGIGFYWINGLAASGKSTLMHYIHLNLASARPDHGGQTDRDVLLLLSFFFYRPSSSSLLKSFEGLWRSLCYQLLTRHTPLFETIQTDSTAPLFVKVFFRDSERHRSWSAHNLKTFFFFLLSKLSAREKCILLIDGLDEFAENQIQLLQDLRQLVKEYPTMQVCCTSRPEALFQLTFNNEPSLRLQDLTTRDMQDYCRRQLVDTKAAFLVDKIV